MSKSRNAQLLDGSDECRNIAGELNSLIRLAQMHGISTTALENAQRELDWIAREFRAAQTADQSTEVHRG